MLSSRAAAFSVDALLRENNTQQQEQIPAMGTKPEPHFGQCEAQDSPDTSNKSPSKALDESLSRPRQVADDDETKTSYMFTKDEDGWLSIKGKECKIFPFKIADPGTGLPSSAKVCQGGANRIHNTIPRSRVTSNPEFSATSTSFFQVNSMGENCTMKGSTPVHSLRHPDTSVTEINVRSSSVDDILRSARRGGENVFGRRSSLSHPSVLNSVMMNHLEESSVLKSSIPSMNTLPAIPRNAVLSKQPQYMSSVRPANVDIERGRLVSQATDEREANFNIRISKLRETNFTNLSNQFSATEMNNVTNKASEQFLKGNLNFNTIPTKSSSTTKHFIRTGEMLQDNRRYPHCLLDVANSRICDTQRLENHKPMQTDFLFNASAEEGTPMHVVGAQNLASGGDGYRNEARLRQDESSFRNWSSPLFQHPSLLRSVLQGEAALESRGPDGPGSRGEQMPGDMFAADDRSEGELVRLRGGVTVELLQKDLWQKFHQHGTEMIITKIGRRMFPVLRVRIRGLDPTRLYLVYVDMQAVDNKRYRYVYQSSRWLVAGAAEAQQDAEAVTPARFGPTAFSVSTQPHGTGSCPGSSASNTGTVSAQPHGTGSCTGSTATGVYLHPHSPATGAHWMAPHTIAFDKLKLTNRRGAPGGQICLHSMQKYQPRIWIQEVSPDAALVLPGGDLSQTSGRDSCSTNSSGTPADRPFSASPPQLEDKMDTMDVDVVEERTKVPYRRRASAGALGKAAADEWLAKIDRRLADVAVFPVTSFITVTAYQNQQVTRLKISANPFAKGFRDTVKQREDCDVHQQHGRAAGVLHEQTAHPFYHPNLKNPFPSFFPQQTYLHPSQVINPFTNYPPFLFSSFPFFAHQWSDANQRSAEAGLPCSDDPSRNLTNSINVPESRVSPMRSTLPWEHSSLRSSKSQDHSNKPYHTSPSSSRQLASVSNTEGLTSGNMKAAINPSSNIETLSGASTLLQISLRHDDSPSGTIQSCRSGETGTVKPNEPLDELMDVPAASVVPTRTGIDVSSGSATSSNLGVYSCDNIGSFQSKIFLDSKELRPHYAVSKAKMHGMSTNLSYDLGTSVNVPHSEFASLNSSLSQVSANAHEQKHHFTLYQRDQVSTVNGTLKTQLLLDHLNHVRAFNQLPMAADVETSNVDCLALDLTKKKPD